MSDLISMIERQMEFQRRLGNDLAGMTTTDRINFIKDMYIAATQELGEALDEVSWKPWTNGDPRFAVLAFLNELTDVWCFVMNMWLAAMPHASAEQIALAMTTAYDAKMLINFQRQDDGYDGISSKCPECGRALDDPTVQCTPDLGYCVAKDPYAKLPGTVAQ